MIDIEKVRKDFTTIKEEFVNQCDNYIRGEKPLSTLDKAISELERLQQKETPMKVIVYDDEHAFECSNCLKHGVTDSMWLFTEIGEYDYCPRCGQRLDWNDSE
jgi:hypothetical protein